MFAELCQHLEKEYKALCKTEYSKDVWLRGWNIKFKKAGKSLCTVYPKKHGFTVLVVVGNKEKEQVEKLLTENMESAYELAVKLKADLNEGESWYELK